MSYIQQKKWSEMKAEAELITRQAIELRNRAQGLVEQWYAQSSGLTNAQLATKLAGFETGVLTSYVDDYQGLIGGLAPIVTAVDNAAFSITKFR